MKNNKNSKSLTYYILKVDPKMKIHLNITNKLIITQILG